MEKPWISPDTITGDAATGKRYLRREYINETFWREVRKGNHILFVAPRRVGKTSIMKDLAENCPEGFAAIYQNIEGVKTGNEFYQRLFSLILQCIDRSPVAKAKAFVANCRKKYNIQEITRSGIKFGEKELNYEKEVREIIPQLREAEVHTVIFLDEFSEVINKLNQKGLQEEAVALLHTLREIRSDDNFKQFTLVFAGSVGLEHVVTSIDRPKLINDLHPINTGPLTDAEASQLILQLTDGVTIQLSAEVTEAIKTTIRHLLPYYIQLMLEELDAMAKVDQQPRIKLEMINIAFRRVLKKDKNFEDWLERLKSYYVEAFPFINEILVHTAHNGNITVREIYHKAIQEKYQRTEDYMNFVDQLTNDGYLTETENHVYSFTSPFLHQFWLRKYPIYA
ncbi:MAG: ATP-binding protein [Chitinophagaceae bacterium]|nr:ATP-binding protein [Chitinophagaceae bacterium]